MPCDFSLHELSVLGEKSTSWFSNPEGDEIFDLVLPFQKQQWVIHPAARLQGEHGSVAGRRGSMANCVNAPLILAASDPGLPSQPRLSIPLGMAGAVSKVTHTEISRSS